MMNNRVNKQGGFTLVEMLVALVIFGVVGTGIMSLYVNSSATYESQNLVAEAQQNVRAAVESIAFDLRNAGYNPTGAAIPNLGFVQAGTNILQVTMDLSDDAGTIEPRNPDGDLSLGGLGVTADPNENLTYSLYNAAVNDIYGNPISRLGRNTGAGNDPVAEYIHAIGFAYAFDSDGDGALDFDNNGTPADLTDDRIYWAIQDPAGSGTWFELDATGDGLITPADDTDSDNVINSVQALDAGGNAIPVDLDDIRAVKIWVLATPPRRERSYTSTQSYVVGNQVLTPNDAYRRRLLTTTVVCRNMGL